MKEKLTFAKMRKLDIVDPVRLKITSDDLPNLMRLLTKQIT
jgi:hypothetical protein